VRIVSLVPSVTDTLLDWGVIPVACTRFCERPELVHVGGTKDPDIDSIVELRPDLVVVDEEENRREHHAALTAARIEVFVLRIRSLDDVGEQLPALAARVGVAWSMPMLASPHPPSAAAFVPIWKRPWMALGTPTYGASLLEHLGISNVFAGAGSGTAGALTRLASAMGHHTG
jgi:ABC-type Fe3+-hydroxamate transport system substrate-binding protein